MNEYITGIFQKEVNIPLRKMIPLSVSAVLSGIKTAFWV